MQTGQLLVSASRSAAVHAAGQDNQVVNSGALCQYDAIITSDEAAFSSVSTEHSLISLSSGDDLSDDTRQQNVIKRQKRIACWCPNCVGNEKRSTEKKKRVHICHKCEKTYAKTSHLRAHLRWHEGIKPYKCRTCVMCFTRSDELQRHVRSHTGERRFQCTICEKKFMRSDHLKKHIKTHGPKRNVHTQAVINKTETKRGSEEGEGEVNEAAVIQQDDVHIIPEYKCLQDDPDVPDIEGEKSFQCIICEKNFARSPHLKKHINTHEPKQCLQTRAALCQVKRDIDMDECDEAGESDISESVHDQLDDSCVFLKYKCLPGLDDPRVEGDINDERAAGESGDVQLDDSHVFLEYKCLQGPDDPGIEGESTVTVITPASEHQLQ